MTMQRFQISGPFEQLFAGWFAGAYTIPTDVIAAAVASQALAGAERDARTRRDAIASLGDEADHRNRVFDELISTVRQSAVVPIDPWAKIRTGRAEIAAAAEDLRLASECANRADAAFRTAVRGGAETIVVAHLRVAFDRLVADARHLPADREERAPTLAVLVIRYQAIMAAMLDLEHGLTLLPRDEERMHVDTAAIPDPRAQTNGPADPAERVLWLASDAGRPFLPTFAQRDERWELVARFRSLSGRDPGRHPGLAGEIRAVCAAAEAVGV